jgi:general stress protein YciG
MDRNKQREIASKGGKAAHQLGRAHQWTTEEARTAGRRGGIASHRRKREAGEPRDEAPVPSRDEAPDPPGNAGEEKAAANESKDY